MSTTVMDKQEAITALRASLDARQKEKAEAAKNELRARYRQDRAMVLDGRMIPHCKCDVCLGGYLQATGRRCDRTEGPIVEPQFLIS